MHLLRPSIFCEPQKFSSLYCCDGSSISICDGPVLSIPPSIDGGVGTGDDIAGTLTDGDITPMAPMGFGDWAAIIDDTDDGPPICAGEVIFIDAGDIAIGVVAGVCTDGDIALIGFGDCPIIIGTDGGPNWAGDEILDAYGDIAAGVVAGVCTDGDMPPIWFGDCAAIIDDTDDGPPIWAGEVIFIEAGDIAAGVVAGVITDGDILPIGIGECVANIDVWPGDAMLVGDGVIEDIGIIGGAGVGDNACTLGDNTWALPGDPDLPGAIIDIFLPPPTLLVLAIGGGEVRLLFGIIWRWRAMACTNFDFESSSSRTRERACWIRCHAICNTLTDA